MPTPSLQPWFQGVDCCGLAGQSGSVMTTLARPSEIWKVLSNSSEAALSCSMMFCCVRLRSRLKDWM